VCKCIHVHITSFEYKLPILKISMCNVNYRLAVELINLSNTLNYLKTLKKDNMSSTCVLVISKREVISNIIV